jgi:hypothetical protein
MKRLALALPALLLLGPASVFAQQVGTPNYTPGNRGPLLSPYLNLNSASGAAFGYFNQTRPEFQRRSNDVLFRQQFGYLESRPLLPAVTPPDELFGAPPGSGHETAFMNYGGYFPQGGGRYGQPAARNAAPPPRR